MDLYYKRNTDKEITFKEVIIQIADFIENTGCIPNIIYFEKKDYIDFIYLINSDFPLMTFRGIAVKMVGSL